MTLTSDSNRPYIRDMKPLAAPLIALCLAAAPAAHAQEQEPDTGRSLMEQGMELFFEGLRDEMSPALRELQGLADEMGPPMRDFLREMGPAMARILAQVEDWTRYEAPEILPNGDIIIRRKRDDEAPKPDAPEAPAGPTDI